MDDECKLHLIWDDWSVYEYKTSMRILSAQSAFFQALTDASDNKTLILRMKNVDELESARQMLSLVAVPPNTNIEQILSYPFLDSLFIDRCAGFEFRLYHIWRLLHKWLLNVMLQRFKYELHARLFSNGCIDMTEIKKMETAIYPQHDTVFFRSCYAIGLARDAYGLRTQMLSDAEKNWQTVETPVWQSEAAQLREIITKYRDPKYRDKASYWTNIFPCFQTFCAEAKYHSYRELYPPS